MWIESDQYRDINSALERRSREILERLFSKFHSSQPLSSKSHQKPTLCPSCRKPLIRKAVPYVELFVSACPDHHGAWLSSDTAEKLREFIHEELNEKKPKASPGITLRPYLVSWVILSFVITVLAQIPSLITHMLGVNEQGIAASRIGPHYWPTRIQESWQPLNYEGAGITDEEDRNYIDFIGIILEQAITNRKNIDDALQIPRKTEDRASVIQFFEEHQLILISVLSRAKVPERLKGFHERLIRALTSQIEFYGDLGTALQEGRKEKKSLMMDHPGLIESHSALLDAWEEFSNVAPDPRHPLSQGMYERLCALDIV